MLTGRQLHGLRVIDGRSGRECGFIRDALTDAAGRILGFQVVPHGWISRVCYIPAERFSSCDINGAILRGEAIPGRLKRHCPPAREAIPLLTRRGGDICDHQGRCLGTVSDVLIGDYCLQGLEISRGVWHDLRSGRQQVTWSQVRQQGQGFTLIDQL